MSCQNKIQSGKQEQGSLFCDSERQKPFKNEKIKPRSFKFDYK